MNAHIDYHISEQDGRYFAMMPLEQFTELVDRAGEASSLTLPHEVVSRHLVDDVPLVRCWREYLSMTQADLAKRLTVSQAQIAQWEQATAKLRHATLKKVAAAMGIHVCQLILED
jgi:ribosome-binding protein aMBF1 (putative translation factor)